MPEKSDSDEIAPNNEEEKLERSSIVKFILGMMAMLGAMIFAYFHVGPSGQRSSLIDIFLLFLPQSILFVGFAVLFPFLGILKIVKYFKRK